MDSSSPPSKATPEAPSRALSGNDRADATVVSARPEGAGTQISSVNAIGRALEGQSLGPYTLERFVGGGGMGAVFRAVDTTLDRVVAVKVLSQQQSSDAELLRRFRNEAQSAARLDHENIGRVYAVGTEKGWHFIVFEFIEGTNLREFVAAHGPLEVPLAIQFTAQVADALEHASQRDVVHRDIKPSNIIITPAGRARVVDMGLARMQAVAGREDLTVSGMTLGTFDYISPEQARDPRDADVRSDLYSLGCTLFFMLAGRAPFSEGTVVQKLLQHQQGEPPDVCALRPDVPERLAGVVARLMAKQPADRYQRPAGLVADLRAVAHELGFDIADLKVEAAVEGEPVARPRRSPWPWLVPLLGLAAVVFGLWGMSVWQRLQGASVRSRQAVVGGGDGQTEPAVTQEQAVPLEGVGGRRVWRVVEVPEQPGEVGSCAEALQQAADGEVIELAGDSIQWGPPCTVQGKSVTLRAAAGWSPVVRCVPDISEPGAAVADAVATCTIESGTLTFQGIHLRMDVPTTPPRPAVMVALAAGGVLECSDGELEMRRQTPLPGGRSRSPPAGDEEATIIKLLGQPGTGDARAVGPRCGMRMDRMNVSGYGVFLDASAGGVVDVVWSGGRCVVGQRFLIANGALWTASRGASIRLALRGGLFACREGFVWLSDSPERPLPPQLQVFAGDCRFLTPPGRAFLEQSGMGAADGYRGAIEWLDGGSRYEGSALFRRIDALAEREEIDIHATAQGLQHVPGIAGWAEGAEWEFGEP